MQLKPEVRSFVVPRWSAWLSAALERADASPNDLARELLNARKRRQEDVDDRNVPRDLVSRWMRGEKPCISDSAYAVGSALAMLGHPYANGLLAVVAAGYFPDFTRFVRAHSDSVSNASFAANAIENVLLVAEGDVAEARGWSPELKARRMRRGGIVAMSGFPPLAESVERSRSYLSTAKVRFNAPAVELAWQRRLRTPHYDSQRLARDAALLSLAIQCSDARDVSMVIRWETVAGLLDRWAHIIVKRYHTQAILEDLDHSDYINIDLRDLIRLSDAKGTS